MTDDTAQAMREVADRLFAAIVRGDVDEVGRIYHPHAVIWHNTDRLETTAAENLAVLAGYVKRAPQRAYENRRVTVTETGFVQQHLLVASDANGRRLELEACVICQVRDGRITRLDEYFDTQPLERWLA